MSINKTAIEKPNRTLFVNSNSKLLFLLFRCLRMLIAMAMPDLLKLVQPEWNGGNSTLNTAGLQASFNSCGLQTGCRRGKEGDFPTLRWTAGSREYGRMIPSN